jgi:hypothetical protein
LNIFLVGLLWWPDDGHLVIVVLRVFVTRLESWGVI